MQLDIFVASNVAHNTFNSYIFKMILKKWTL